MRLIACSNSAPQWQGQGGLRPRSPGGLVPILSTLLQQHGGDWVFAAPSGIGRPNSAPIHLGNGVSLHPVHVPERVARQHYEQVGVRLLLWLFHYLLDTAQQPTFDGDLASAWAGYEAVNRNYAERIRRLTENSPDELILLNDYHVFLVPAFLEASAPRRRSRLAFFHGLPWCEPEYFGILPAWIRDRILESLLRCDVVGFHATRWAEAFLACCHRLLVGAEVSARTVAYRGRRTVVTVAPFPLDIDVLDRRRSEPATERWQVRLGALAAGRRVIARADRLDLWKNLPRGFAAYQALLERRPRLADDWWFCAVVTPPSRPTERSRAYNSLCHSMVDRINDQFGRRGRQAATLVFPKADDHSRNCVVAALASSDVTLANPTFDGLNLVAKEALYLAERTPLLLSVNAGAHEQLAPYVTGLHPFDVQATAASLDAAMKQGAGAPSAAQQLLREESTGDWLATLIQVWPP
jgi:trehalose 6-phosphate synthase